MIKSVLISIRPQWCELIANGKKTIEVRKTRPKLETPFKCYIYCTQDKEHTLFKDWVDPPFVVKEYNIMQGKGVKNVFAGHRPWGNANGKVIGEFVCDRINRIAITGMFDDSGNQIENGGQLLLESACLTSQQFVDYIGVKNGYGWHISALQIYDKPRELSEFYRATGGVDVCANSTHCEMCKHWRYIRVNSEEYDMDCDCGGPLLDKLEPLTRPPQSWCYVEALDAK